MKLGDFRIEDDDVATEATLDLVRGFNRTQTDYPRESTVPALFAEQAAATPDAPAILDESGVRTYREVEEAANRLAHLLREEGLRPEDCVAVSADDAFVLVTALLGILKAGGAYVPLDPQMPLDRARYILGETEARFLVGDRSMVRRMNRLQMECARLWVLVCPDSDDFHSEPEGVGGKMRREVWDYVGETMVDDITGGGWKSSYTGEWLGRKVMDEYGESARMKLAPFCHAATRVLEIGCASGITMRRVAPLVGDYIGIDLSPEILRRTEREMAALGITNVRLRSMPADAIDRLGEGEFDLVILNSVLQCFSGPNYLRDVLRKAIALLRPGGRIFLGNVFDQDLAEEFFESLRAYKKEHPGAPTKLDWSEELFLDRAWFEDLGHDLPAIRSVSFTRLVTTEESEISRFTFDVLMEIDRGAAEETVHLPTPRRRACDRRALAARPETAPPETTGSRGLAYVIFTSGTTGRPKGVLVEHRAIVRLVRNTNYLALDASTRFLQTGALSFDASTLEIWGPLLNGGALAKPPEMALLDVAEMKRLVRVHGITTLWLTTGLFNQFVDADMELFRGLRDVLTGGEKISDPHARRLLAIFPGLRLVNCYGPTENTTFSTTHRVDPEDPRETPIGAPIANSGAWILGPGDELCGVGVPGEICVSGDGLARGYLKDPELTERRFVPHPFEPGERLYRTGDRGRWRADGVIEFLGRLDEQVKVRGYRIEPGEIEARLLEDATVKNAIVIARDAAGGGRELVAYVTGKEAVVDAVRDRLKSILPEYMIPAHIVRLDRLPLTSNGKIDRRALPDPPRAARALGRELTQTEKVLAGIWEGVLGVTSPGPDDDFFDLGGHSLKVTSVVARIEAAFGLALPLAIVFRATTLRALAAAVQDAARFGVSLADETRVLLRDTGGSPVFAFPPGTGDVLSYIPIAAALDDTALHAFNFIESPSRLGDYADLIAQVQPSGPVTLLGYSSGGNLAYRVAVELERRGRSVGALVLIDSGRKVAPIDYREETVMSVAQDFLDHESIRPYVENPALRDKMIRRIQASYRAYCLDVDDEVLAAPIRLLRAAEGPREYRDEAGKLIVTQDGWAELTRGGFQVVDGSGSHNAMLMGNDLVRNMPLLARILGASAGCS